MNIFEFAAGHPGFAFLLALVAAVVVSSIIAAAVDLLKSVLHCIAIVARGYPAPVATPPPAGPEAEG